MKMTREQKIVSTIERISIILQDAALTSMLQGHTITKVDFKGNDLLLRLSSGKQIIISAIDSRLECVVA